MARGKKTVKAQNDNSEFFEALRLMEEERGIPKEFIAEKGYMYLDDADIS